MPDQDLTRQLKFIVGEVRTMAQVFHPGSVHPWAGFHNEDEQDGFGLSAGAGLGVVWALTTGSKLDMWSINFSAAIAFDVRPDYKVAEWINNQNRASGDGRYYYAMGNDGSWAVIWETSLWSKLLNNIGQPGSEPMVNWINIVLTDCLDHSSNQAKHFIGQFGGRLLSPNDMDISFVLAAATAS